MGNPAASGAVLRRRGCRLSLSICEAVKGSRCGLLSEMARSFGVMPCIVLRSETDVSDMMDHNSVHLHLMNTDMLETRAKPRRPVNRAGTITINKVTALECIVRDYSASGVRLEIIGAAAVPAEFTLSLAGVATPRLCRLVWRDGQALGASFIESTSA